MRPDHTIAAAIVVAILVAVFGCGWFLSKHFYQPKIEPVVETYAKPIDHGDGSSTMARVVDRGPDTAAPTMPAGSHVIATAEVVVKPDAAVNGDCLPVTVRVDLTESKDGGLRAHERVEGGETLDAVHYAPPVRYVVTERRWGVGVDYRDGEASAALERYYPGARIGLTVGENTVGAALVFRF